MKIPALLFVAITTGCTGGSLLSVDFDRLDVDSVDWNGASGEFVFLVNNPNPIGINIDRFNYQLDFADVEWLVGDDPDGLSLLASDASEVALPVDVVFTDLFDMVQATRGDDNIPFGLSGEFGFRLSTDTIDTVDEEAEGETLTTSGIEEDEDGFILNLPYNAGGDFPALRRPAFSFQNIEVDWSNTSLSNAAFNLNVGVDNEHESSLWFTNFDYALSVDGTSVATGLVDDLGEVVGASEVSSAGVQVITLPINVDLSTLGGVGTDIYSALIMGTDLDLGLEASTDVDTPFGLVPLSIDQSGAVSINQ